MKKTDFNPNWITTEIMASVKPVNLFHRMKSDTVVKDCGVKNYHVYFRRKFNCKSSENIKIRISADDYYKLYINGKFVCQGPAPAYHMCYHFNETDISSHLIEGENVIAVHVFYSGLINRVCNSGDGRFGLATQIYSDSKILLETDSSWLYSEAHEFSGETVGYDTAFLENIDFRKFEKGWTEYAFDDSKYKNAVVLKSDDHIFTQNPVDCVDTYQIKPKEIKKTAPGKYFIDFGHEITGSFKMSVKGDEGQKVCVMCGEETSGENRTRFEMRCGCTYKEVCTLSGNIDVFDFFDYKAFRYVNLETDIDNLLPETFAATVRHHKFNEKIFLKTDIPYLSEIWNICRNSLKYGIQEGFLDCPTREKGQYLGDFTVSGLAYMILTGDREAYKKTLFDFAETLKFCPGMLAVAPGSIMQEIADFSLLYPLQVLNYYKYTSDKDTVSELYGAVKSINDYFKKFEREDGLLQNVNEKWNLIDWPKNLRDNYEVSADDYGDIGCHNVINAYYIGAMLAENVISDILGAARRHDTAKYTKSYIKSFYKSHEKIFYDTEKRINASLHSNALALFYGLVPEEAVKNVVRLIMKKGLCCGVFFSFFVLKALAKSGAFKEEAALLLNESEHSWVNMIREGATTLFEAWGKEQKWNTSLCHPWGAAPIIVLAEDLGIFKENNFLYFYSDDVNNLQSIIL